MAMIPDAYTLNQNYPNPFNPSTTISYGLPTSGHVSLVIYDMRGSTVSQLVNTYQSAGTHIVHFNAADFPAGTYLYMLEANGEQHVKRMLLLK
ncbi:MAG: T9SS type A sorting domain-containing protein [FCB group bacterium]|nr:T9SS type A sorting domain-containing protein [FCB group bacterium]MBL7120973.1 T9SS type A sorting domain-containing protein [Candidatus Neomarinimicrobiota bacterium]